ncbi:CopG family transcriptional regulator [Saccharophagus degradans]|uniref:CopG family transcriptional regulator n=1 Tax=Saccharophagus degradans TaxID=86304 RepID=A0AAW7XBJ1_9GAMM|nr:CopG family transcriptional regulator [Saccharophagus degradans]MDO6424222.1 CopG family transcriptional regulator [Saccharophagus degradans]MDO6608269.1 CopG family transcriptional regulator [Saccharophagus degradans]WGO96797.1 CopG family transcriptional regulator [Saccharophagus degradans]
MEQRTARLTLLIDPKKKSIFDELCAKEDVTASQKVRQFIRDYIEQQLGPDWQNSVLVGDDETKDIKR